MLVIGRDLPALRRLQAIRASHQSEASSYISWNTGTTPAVAVSWTFEPSRPVQESVKTVFCKLAWGAARIIETPG